MPTYEYLCPECGHEFERFQQMTEKPLSKCPRCGSVPQRLIGTGAGLILKGKGFHQNDYGSSGKTRCGAGATCCGRDTPCAAPPCRD